MQYFRPNSFDEFLKLDSGNAIILSGGTDLIPHYERGQKLPNKIIDIKKISDLYGIKESNTNIEIGAATSIQEIQDSALIKKKCSALYQSTIDFGSVQIRNRATIGGNICNASPAGDTWPALYAFDAKLLLVNKDGNRLVGIDEFILGPGQNDIRDGEILQKIIFPNIGLNSIFYKLGLRQAMAISVINFAIAYQDDQIIIAVGALAPTILKFEFKGQMSIETIVEEIEQKISPIDDIRATAEYRRKVLKNMLSYELAKII